MKITISCTGAVSRGLILAAGFDKRGLLREMHTPYWGPRHPWARSAPTRGIATEHTRDYLDVALQRRVRTATHGATPPANLPWQQRFDERVAAALTPGADIVFAESMVALKTLERARASGSVAILDRTNTHIAHQQAVLADAYEQAGLEPLAFHTPEGIARGEAEYEAAQFICTLSSFARRTFIDAGVAEDKLLLVPSATNLSAFTPHPKRDDAFRLVFVGYVSIKKGVHHLLEALAGMESGRPELLLVGGVDPAIQPWLDRYEGMYELGGFVPHAGLPDVLSQASAFVLPSLEEGLAKVVMEAMACGVPVIATPNTGAEDVVRDGVDGWIVPAGDPHALRTVIERAGEDLERLAGMGRAARLRVQTGFSWNDYVERMLATYESVLARSQATSAASPSASPTRGA